MGALKPTRLATPPGRQFEIRTRRAKKPRFDRPCKRFAASARTAMSVRTATFEAQEDSEPPLSVKDFGGSGVVGAEVSLGCFNLWLQFFTSRASRNDRYKLSVNTASHPRAPLRFCSANEPPCASAI